MGESLYTGVVEVREEAARLRAREAQAAVLRRELANVHRQVARTARNYQSVADRKDAAWSKVLKACELLLELQSLDRQLDRLPPIQSLPYLAAKRLIPELASQCQRLLLTDETAKRAVGHLASDPYGAAHVLLRMAGKSPTTRRTTKGGSGVPVGAVLRGSTPKAKAAKKGKSKRAVVTRPAPRTKGLSADARAMLGIYDD